MAQVAYIHEEKIHNKSAPKIVLPILFDLFRPSSIVDVGCGLGTWVSVAQEMGVADIVGIDGDYVDRTKLTIPTQCFAAKDLTTSFDMQRRFDMLISLEVAEHLPEASAASFIASLIRHSDVIVFSAAIPGQGGQNHINEQWLSYWTELFRQHNYKLFDIVRSKLWDIADLEVWYKQNMVIFLKSGHPLEEKFMQQPLSPVMNIVHPELFDYYHKHAERAAMMEEGRLGMKTAWTSFKKALFQKIR